ncbi:uncharacterized protein E0L32_006084 [Thyridium curvatum]|uniref:Uncharacterized protein n=1 Tax=Thyridium curvatum TaxID=1093900 RepID=A0A507B155_9PEZI|nr:uncharacterized protein E0L32_006084 [Thyridium curvatum]TPX13613.1 hypothetical protein E0L32_006084 [Thyridium curvatum]
MSAIQQASSGTQGQSRVSFSHLPPQVREMVYRYALVRDEPIKNDEWPLAVLMPPALAQLNKETRREVIEIYFGENTFHLHLRASDFDRWSKFIGFPHLYNTFHGLQKIEKVQLEMGPSVYFSKHTNPLMPPPFDSQDRAAVVNRIDDLWVRLLLAPARGMPKPIGPRNHLLSRNMMADYCAKVLFRILGQYCPELLEEVTDWMHEEPEGW